MPRYDTRREHEGWAIIDRRTGNPIVLNGTPQTGFSVDGAQDFADILNRKDARARFLFGKAIVDQGDNSRH